MIIFVLGEPKSGKSVWAENVLLSLGGTSLYVGTLPARQEFHETIIEHQKRRLEAKWDLLEASGEPGEDLKALSQALQKNSTVLIDGLSAYIPLLYGDK